MNVFIGIDPGVNGVILVLGEDRVVQQIFMIPKIGSTSEVDKRGLVTIFENLTILYGDRIRHIAMEKVHAIFGSSAGATFTFGGIVWAEEILLIAYDLPFTLVTPKDWQKELWQGVTPLRKPGKRDEKTGKIKEGAVLTKETSLIAVQRLFPKEKLTDPSKPKSTKPHDGIVDALLLAEYARRKFS